MNITSIEQLRELYGHPKVRARDKVLPGLDKHGRNFIAQSPFLILSTCGQDGRLDASPRGGDPGFVKVLDDTTLLMPDGKGNNRLDSLVNVLETGSVGMLFLLPGIDETLRINGRAHISVAPDHLAHFAALKNPPRTCLVIQVEEAFLHCAKALMRSRLWDDSIKLDRDQFPSMGEMLKDQLGSSDPVESREDMVRRYTPDL